MDEPTDKQASPTAVLPVAGGIDRFEPTAWPPSYCLVASASEFEGLLTQGNDTDRAHRPSTVIVLGS
jgi:hypothetical protein